MLDLLKIPYDMFKNRESFSLLKVEGPCVIRMDGVKFGKYSKALNARRDEKLHRALVESAKELIQTYSCDSAYISSDEVNVFCKNPPFGGRVEKLDSVFASFLGASFSAKVSPLPPGWFDARVVLIAENEWPLYVAWRLKVTLCNYVSYVTKRPCGEALKVVKPPALAYGTLLVRQEVQKKGYDPIRKVEVLVTRRKIVEVSGEEVLQHVKPPTLA